MNATNENLIFDEKVKTELSNLISTIYAPLYAQQINVITPESINQMVKSVYSDVLTELRRYTKMLMLKTLGITIDSWGHVTEISNELYDLVMNQPNIEKLKTKLIQNINLEVEKYLETDAEIKYNNIKIIKRVVDKSINTLNDELTNNIEQEIISKALTHYKTYILEQINNTPLVAQTNIRKL